MPKIASKSDQKSKFCNHIWEACKMFGGLTSFSCIICDKIIPANTAKFDKIKTATCLYCLKPIKDNIYENSKSKSFYHKSCAPIFLLFEKTDFKKMETIKGEIKAINEDLDFIEETEKVEKRKIGIAKKKIEAINSEWHNKNYALYKKKNELDSESEIKLRGMKKNGNSL